jgi:hypothetical protein
LVEGGSDPLWRDTGTPKSEMGEDWTEDGTGIAVWGFVGAGAALVAGAAILPGAIVGDCSCPFLNPDNRGFIGRWKRCPTAINRRTTSQ